MVDAQDTIAALEKRNGELQRLLELAREKNIPIFYTESGRRPDLVDSGVTAGIVRALLPDGRREVSMPLRRLRAAPRRMRMPRRWPWRSRRAAAR